MASRHSIALVALFFALPAAPSPALAELDLRRAAVSRLDNGLTVILLEERAFPLVSVQMIYRSGARDETAPGLAHFVEHLAFRGSEAFPNGAATDAIYDAGGEWHGYTWLDQTSYFATIPAAGLDLLLRIEADRMARMTIDAVGFEAERGAVLAEMQGYAGDPKSLLFDAVAAAAFPSHPYRANTIGSASDIAALTEAQARAFHETHYVPANAVLAIVGDVSPAEAMALVRRHFGALPARPAPDCAAAAGPPASERRLEIAGDVERQHFELAYPAPPASHPSFPAFLLLQQLLSGGSGVNFRQNDWGTPAMPGSALHGLTEDLAGWAIPTAEPYLLTVTATLPAGGDRSVLEAELERRIARLRDHPPAAAELAAARAAVAEQLIFDVETTEDAAHQLAFFAGLGAYDALLDLPERLRAVTAADVQRVARAYLAPHLRTVGWYVPGDAATPGGGAADPPRTGEGDQPGPREAGLSSEAPATEDGEGPAADRAATPPSTGPAPPPRLRRLSGGLPVIVQTSPLAPTATVTLLLTAPLSGEDAPADLPGLGAITRSGRAADLPALIAAAREALTADPAEQDAAPSDHPDTRLAQLIAAEISTGPAGTPAPLAVVISGAVEPDAAFAALEQAFGDLAPTPRRPTAPLANPERRLRTVTARIDRPRAQAALGYVVPAPPPATRDGLAWRMLLYILSHDYGGRLGNSAIRDRGLVYHIDSAYRTNGADSWITLATGVGPARLDAMEAALRAELARLAADPPGEAEVAAARNHLLGRDLSAAQSNPELASRLARMFVETGSLRSHAGLAEMLAEIGPADLAAAVPAFAAGTILRVEVAAPMPPPPPR